ncbi:MAG: GNAT family N-acetyltransferase [Propionibacteriaceae bacterium]|nr:GNAT family N-acetyltransferase [Propionibacteriaceae bacterium]
MTLRDATPADFVALAELEVAFPDRQRWSVGAWQAELAAPDRLVHVIDHGHVVAAATWQCVADVMDLHRIVVAPNQRRRGLARRLLAAGLAWGAGQGARRVLLEVADDNGAAIGLYQAHGFGEIARRRGYYASGRDALIMERPLHPSGLTELEHS